MDPENMFSLPVSDEAATPRLPGRAEVVAAINAATRFDVLIVGGGIHGAAFARLAAFNGLKTALLERDDYAGATSSRSSKMAHGGLRYLEMFDFKQVLEGIRSREELFEVAPHLVRPTRFLIPVPRGKNWFRFKMNAGLFLYDLMVRRKERKHYWIPASKLDPTLFGERTASLAGCFSYTDGIMNDARLVMENIVAARQEGALCLNHASVDLLRQRESGEVEVGWTDLCSGEKRTALAGVVVNCAGPWAPFVGRVTPSESMPAVRYSQGVHLIFDRPWGGPALFLPLAEKSQYYFVWPHFAGTMVGTTERVVDTLERDPMPVASEIDEIIARLDKDLPHSGLNRSSLHHCFAGIRTLPVRGKDRSSSRLSRRHVWSFSRGVLSLIGGKFTTHAWTALEGLKMVFKLAGLNRTPQGLANRPLPGAGGYEGNVAEFIERAEAHGATRPAIDRAISRLGSRVKHFSSGARAFEQIGADLLRGEVEIALQIEQAETLEDLMRRRLDLEYRPGHGLEILDELVSILREARPGCDAEGQAGRYRERMALLEATMRIRGNGE